MISHLHIENYKCIDNADLNIKPLTIVTGLNSTGKSTLIQSILLPECYGSFDPSILGLSTKYDMIRSRYLGGKKSVIVRLELVDGKEGKSLVLDPDDNSKIEMGEKVPSLFDDKGLYYLSANRTIADTEKVTYGKIMVVPDGRNLFSVFDMEKSNTVIEELRKYEESYTLQSQVNYWLTYITGQKLEVTTEKPLDDLVVIKYTSDGLNNISPSNLGTGVTHLAKVLIACLRAKQGNVILVENPEIHLHPSAQAKLGEFFAYVANAGIQIIIETHCEHLINRVQYAVYNHEIKHDDIIILYKGNVTDPFKEIPLQNNGHFNVPFPEGFFDATLSELIEMNV